MSDQAEDSVHVTKPEQGITVITIDRAKRRNAVDANTARKLYAAVIDFENDPEQKVGILHGANGTFCAGFDLHTVDTGLSDSGPHYDTNSVAGTIGPMGPSRLQIKKPFLTAVSGYAVAGGLELSLLGDIRIVEEDAIFGVFCRRWGVPLIDGGTVRLQAIVGLGRAMDMILTGRPVSAQEAFNMGLANRIVGRGRALEEAMGIARQLLRFPQLCMRLDRNSAYYAAYEAKSLEEGLSYEFENGVAAVRAEGAAGAKRFSKGSGRGGDYSKL